MNTMIKDKIGAWLRGLVWTAMIAGTEVFAKGASDITEITMDPDTLNLVGDQNRGRARNTVLKVVRTYTYDKPGMYNMADVEAIRNKLNTGDWHCSVHVRDLKNGTGSDICGKRRTDGMKETAIISVEPKQLTFIHTISKGGGPGDSELGFFPMLPGMHGLPAIAMMDPDAFADMQIGMHELPFIYSTPGMHVFTFDSKEMKGNMDQMEKELKDLKPFTDEQRQEMRQFRMRIGPDGTPEAAPAPKAPTTPPVKPQAAPAPASPQPPQ